jgi:uncharacterized protein (TIGR03086 family)
VDDTLSTDPPATLVRHGEQALSAFRAVLPSLGEAPRTRPTPCADFTVSDLGDHLVRSMVLLGGRAGATLDTPEGDPYDAVVPLAQAALGAWAERGFDGEITGSSRTMPARLTYAIVPMELVVHGWDLATALGTEFVVADDVVEYLLRQAPQLITPDRRGHGFADAVHVASDAPPLHQLIGFTGRQP